MAHEFMEKRKMNLEQMNRFLASLKQDLPKRVGWPN